MDDAQLGKLVGPGWLSVFFLPFHLPNGSGPSPDNVIGTLGVGVENMPEGAGSESDRWFSTVMTGGLTRRSSFDILICCSTIVSFSSPWCAYPYDTCQ